MINRYISNEFCIFTNDEQMQNDLKRSIDFQFKIKLSELAIRPKLLMAFGFVSMYAESYARQSQFELGVSPASKDKAVGFFVGYLSDFLGKEPKLKRDDILSVIIPNAKIQDKVIAYFEENGTDFLEN